MQCMDQDGNIDAFRYIEYSRRRRTEFLKRADFITRMQSTLLQQRRSSSLPGTSAVSHAVRSWNHTVACEGALAPATGNPRSAGHSVTASSSSRGSSVALDSSHPRNEKTSSLGSQPRDNSATAAKTDTDTKAPVTAYKTEDAAEREAMPPHKRRAGLRKEEVEAAEALLFGMGRGSSARTHASDDKRNDCPSSEDECSIADRKNSNTNHATNRNNTNNNTTGLLRKRKIVYLSSCSRIGTIACEEQRTASEVSVVSIEEESHGKNHPILARALHGLVTKRAVI